MSTAVVVGGGPNGLAAALSLAAEGVQVTVLEAADEVGGGTRSSEAIVPGLLHDHCSAIHPMAVGSQFLSSFNLDRYGLSWRWPEIDCVHPLDDGSAGVLHRSVEQTAAGLGRDGSRWRARIRLPGREVRRTQRGHHAAPAAVPAPSADAGPVRGAHRASRVHVRPAVPHRAGARLVRRRCGPCLPAAALPDDLRHRDGHHRGRPPARLGGGRRWIAVDHQRDGVAAGRLGRQDRDRCPGPDGVAAAAGRRHDVRSGAQCGRRDPGGPSSAPNFSCLHQVPARSGCVQSRLRRRGRCALDEPGRPAGRHRAPGRDLLRTRRDRAGDPRRTHARAAVRTGWSAVSCRSATLGGQYPSGVELRARPERLHGRRDRGDHRPDRAVRPRLPGSHHRVRRFARRRRWTLTTPISSVATS